MRRQDIITVMAVPNLDRLGYAVAAMFGLKTSSGLAEEVAETVAQYEEAQCVTLTTAAMMSSCGPGFRRCKNSTTL